MTQVWGVSHMGYLYLLLTALPLLLLLLTSPPLPVKLLLLWLMMAYGVVMCGFFSFLGVSERVLGKRRDGVIPLWSLFLFSPWFFGVNLVWYLSNFYHNFFENVSDEVFEGLHVGRLPRTSKDIPPNTTLIVDLTAEFSAHHSIISPSPSSPSPSSPSSSSHSPSPSPHWSYLCCPSFDTLAPAHIEIVTETLSRMITEQGPIYVHCAFGHGRSATFAAAWLILKGHVQDVEEAEALMKRSRPTVGLNITQKAFLSLYLQEMEKKRGYDVLLGEGDEGEGKREGESDNFFDNDLDGLFDVENNKENYDYNDDENEWDDESTIDNS